MTLSVLVLYCMLSEVAGLLHQVEDLNTSLLKMKRHTKLFEFANLDDQEREEPTTLTTVKRPRSSRSDSSSSEVPPESTPLTLGDSQDGGMEETQSNTTGQ